MARSRSHQRQPTSTLANVRPHVEALEDRVQPGETLFLGFTTLALLDVLPPAAASLPWDGTEPDTDLSLNEIQRFLPAERDGLSLAMPSKANRAHANSPLVHRHQTESSAWESSLDSPRRFTQQSSPVPAQDTGAALAVATGGAPLANGGTVAISAHLSAVSQFSDASGLLAALAGHTILPAVSFDATSGTLVVRGGAGDDFPNLNRLDNSPCCLVAESTSGRMAA